MKDVLSFGAGVQSTTLLLMSCKGVLPKLDHVVFADTQWEPAAVYRHLEWCKEYAAKHGISIAVRTAGNLRKDLLDSWGSRDASGRRTIRAASIPFFFKNADGSRGMVRRQCTTEYKIDVIERYLREELLGLQPRQRWPLDLRVRQWIGISTDEVQRMKHSLRPAVVMWHPLIEADALARKVPGRMFPVGYSRQDCLDWMRDNGFPTPPRSACIGCPFRRNEEWGRLTSDEFADACEVDRLIRENDRLRDPGKAELRGEPYLHSSLIPLSEVTFLGSDAPEVGMENECGGVCGV